MQGYITDFVQRKIAIAKRLYEGECAGSYTEAVIILSSVLSGIASEVWPGKGIDRFRFVELCANYCDSDLGTKNISIPLLIWDLERNGDKKSARSLRSRFSYFPDPLILTGDQIDQLEEEVRKHCSRIGSKKIRQLSYANLFYQEVRSGFIHEYQTGNLADSFPMTSHKANVSYVNIVSPPYRKIYFHFHWLIRVLESISVLVESLSDKLPLQMPRKWWLDGNVGNEASFLYSTN